MKTEKTGAALWQGGLKDGRGEISTESGALASQPYGFSHRFEGEKGTNPEELIGAAHAGCFTMALAKELEEAGFTATQINTTSKITLESDAGGFTITAAHLTVQAIVPGIEASEFTKIAEAVKTGCPVSKVLKARISMDAALLQ